MMPFFPHAVAAASITTLADGGCDMAKGQKRSNREPKKPKTSTKKQPGAARPAAAPKK
jgi:hypothetical protein